MHIKNRQNGATLITALIMLIVLTLLVVSGIRSSNTNLRIAGNMQMQEEAVAAAQQAIESVISARTLVVSTQTVGHYTVTFGQLICQSASQISAAAAAATPDCQGSPGTPTCYSTTWDIAATAIDASTGATAEIHQGISKMSNYDEASNNNCGII